jgi:nicotinamide phosphoribosyltransferase
MKANIPLPIPMAISADSYKATHQHQYPKATKMVSYGEFRWGYDKDTSDTRLVHFGIRNIVEQYLHRRCVTRHWRAQACMHPFHSLH